MDADVLNERIRQLKYDNVALKELLHKHDIPYSDKKAEATTISLCSPKNTFVFTRKGGIVQQFVQRHRRCVRKEMAQPIIRQV